LGFPGSGAAVVTGRFVALRWFISLKFVVWERGKLQGASAFAMCSELIGYGGLCSGYFWLTGAEKASGNLLVRRMNTTEK
jgi:hypothetical protein